MYRLIGWIVVGMFFLFPLKAQVHYTPKDSIIFERFLQYTSQGNNDIIRVTRFFLETPYIGGTLEGDSTERLRINLRELDCMTLTENVMALYLMLQSNEHTFENFCHILQRIRYRNGALNGYLSRLHYTSEWLDDNRQKGILALPVLPEGQKYAPNVSFMSTHCDSYPVLITHPEWCAEMPSIEKHINALKFSYIPKQQVASVKKGIQNGDIILITTNTKGLDVSHMGFALLQQGKIYLLHASLEARKVVISQITLYDYLMQHKNQSGIMVARMIR